MYKALQVQAAYEIECAVRLGRAQAMMTVIGGPLPKCMSDHAHDRSQSCIDAMPTTGLYVAMPHFDRMKEDGLILLAAPSVSTKTVSIFSEMRIVFSIHVTFRSECSARIVYLHEERPLFSMSIWCVHKTSINREVKEIEQPLNHLHCHQLGAAKVDIGDDQKKYRTHADAPGLPYAFFHFGWFSIVTS